MRARLSAVLSVAFVSLAGCGAKTGLLVPDIAPDHIDATDAPDLVCLPDLIPLTRRTADVMFLIDRSNSMRADISGQDLPPSRWNVLEGALSRALPPLEATLSFGATFYPQVQLGPPSVEQACLTSVRVDIPPARNNSAAILRVFQNTEPGGGTPTYLALRLVHSWFDAQPATRDPRYIVLATDGGPNCNAALDAATCPCTSHDPTTMASTCPGDPAMGFDPMPSNCLDDGRTLGEMRAVAGVGIPVFVIGIDDPTRPDLTAVLNLMADAGGRPNLAGPERYYRIRVPMDLDTAFQAIERTIAQCTFVTTRAPASFDSIHLDLGTQELPRDATRTNGWDV
ncbi:MAG: vWA domain-containing protein, partial [Deltaproteobacteria bacterium]